MHGKTGSPKRKNRIALQGGTYAMAVTAIVFAILAAANVLASALPKTLTQHDISSTKLYSVTSNTKVVVNALDQDVTIYWIVQADREDAVIENLLGKYESLSGHIEVVKKNLTSIRPSRSSTRRNRYRTTVWWLHAGSAAGLSATMTSICMIQI